ncbi:MAG: DUF5979 domain-containing protein [Lachnospiraceae bacterium]|nr:DUF5979 domain-containing protein [Lachnospiraceae bacterium]
MRRNHRTWLAMLIMLTLLMSMFSVRALAEGDVGGGAGGSTVTDGGNIDGNEIEDKNVYSSADDPGKWTQIDEDTWQYIFDVFDDSQLYYLWEDLLPGYSSNADASDPIEINDAEGKNVKSGTIINTASDDFGTLRISKKVEGYDKEDVSQFDFSFTVTLTGDGIGGSQIFGDTSFYDGVGKITLRDGESCEISGLPAGTSYAVEEDAKPNFTSSPTAASGSIEEGKTAAAEFTNTYHTDPGPGPGPGGDEPNEPQFVDVTLTKVETGRFDEPGTYTVNASFKGLTDNITYTCEIRRSGSEEAEEQTFVANDGEAYPQVTLASGDTAVFRGIPVGAVYAFTEAGGEYQAAYEVTDENQAGKILSSRGSAAEGKPLATAQETADQGEAVKVTFINTLSRAGNVTVTKKISGVQENSANNTDPENALEFGFTIEFSGLQQNDVIYSNRFGRILCGDDGTLSLPFTLKNGEAADFTGIPVGVTYRVTEDKSDSYVAGYKLEDKNGKSMFSCDEDENTAGDTALSTEQETVAEGADVIAAFTNSPWKQPLRITKQFSEANPNFDAKDEFEFVISGVNYMSKAIDGNFQAEIADAMTGSTSPTLVSFDNGNASVTLKGGQSITIEGLQVGTDYTITETGENVAENAQDAKPLQYLVEKIEGSNGSRDGNAFSGSIAYNKGKGSSVTFTNGRDYIPGLSVDKTTTNAEEAPFALGEWIKYKITVTNTGNVKLTNVTVEDTVENGDQRSFNIGELSPDQTKTVYYSHKVTAADIIKGQVHNTAEASGQDPEENILEDEAEVTDPTEEKNPNFRITKLVKIKNSEDDFADVAHAAAGDTASYQVTITNTGNMDLTFKTEDITDVLTTTIANGTQTTGDAAYPLKDLDSAPFVVKAGQGDNTYTFTYELKNIQGSVKELNNTVTAKAANPKGEGEAPLERSDDAKVIVGENHALRVTKTHDEDKEYKPGDTVEFLIKVENIGNTQLKGIKLTDKITVTKEDPAKKTLEELTIPKNAAGVAPESFDLEAGQSQEFTVSYVIGTTETHLLNTATATDEDGCSDKDEDEVTVEKAPELSIKKEVVSVTGKDGTVRNNGVARLGDQICYKVVVTNTGNTALTNVTLYDSLVKEYDEDENEIPLRAEAELASGASFTYEYTYEATEADIKAGKITNTATADSNETSKVTDHTETKTEDQYPDLKVEKKTVSEAKHDGKYRLGETIKYEITVTNTGNVTLENISVEDKLTGDRWTIETLAPGSNKVYEAEYEITEADVEAGHVLNVATAKVPDGPEDEGKDDEDVMNPHISVKKEVENGKSEYGLGDTVEYKLTVKNDGNVDLTDVKVEDDHFGKAAEGSKELPAAIDKLAVGDSVTFRYTYTIKESDLNDDKTLTNTATATGEDPEGNEVKDEDDETVSTGGRLPKIKVEKEVIERDDKEKVEYSLGEKVEYKVIVTNTGNVTLTDVEVTDDHFEEVLEGSGELPATIETLAPGESKEFRYSYTVKEEDLGKQLRWMKNTAKASGKDPKNPDDPVEDEDDEDVVIEKRSPHLTVKKVTTSTPGDGKRYAAGETIEYEITVTNDGNVTLKNISVEDELTGDKWTVKALDPIQSEKFTTSHTVTVDEAKAGTVLNVATAAAEDPNDPDNPPTPEPGKDEEPTKYPHLTVTKKAVSTPKDGEKYAAGETIKYEITVTNDGNIDLENVRVEDKLIEDFAWTIDALAVGNSETKSVEYVVTEEDAKAGTVLNVATATAEDPNDPDNPPTPEPGSDEEPTKYPHIKVKKDVVNRKSEYKLGDTIEYKLVVTNDGNIDLVNITVTDDHFGEAVEGSKPLPATIETLAVGESAEFRYTYTIKESDLNEEKTLTNVAAAKGEDPKDPDNPVEHEDDETITTGGRLPQLKVEKEVIKKAGDKKVEYVLGDRIEYKVTVTNTGNVTLTDIKVTDDHFEEALEGSGKLPASIAKLAPGESVEFRYSYTVKEKDLGKELSLMKNTAAASGIDPENPDKPVEDGDDEDVVIEKHNPHLTVEKVTTSTPKNGKTYGVGETITYKITVTNDGNMTIKDVVITDALTGNAFTVGTLKPGQTSAAYKAVYVVKEADAKAGSVVNVATADGTVFNPNNPDDPAKPGVTPGEVETPVDTKVTPSKPESPAEPNKTPGKPSGGASGTSGGSSGGSAASNPKTGDEIPVYPFVFGGIGVIALLILLLGSRKKKQKQS